MRARRARPRRKRRREKALLTARASRMRFREARRDPRGYRLHRCPGARRRRRPSRPAGRRAGRERAGRGARHGRARARGGAHRAPRPGRGDAGADGLRGPRARGPQGAAELVRAAGADVVLNAIVGAAGWRPASPRSSAGRTSRWRTRRASSPAARWCWTRCGAAAGGCCRSTPSTPRSSSAWGASRATRWRASSSPRRAGRSAGRTARSWPRSPWTMRWHTPRGRWAPRSPWTRPH